MERSTLQCLDALAADEGEPAAEFQDVVTKMYEEAKLELPFSRGRTQGQKQRQNAGVLSPFDSAQDHKQKKGNREGQK